MTVRFREVLARPLDLLRVLVTWKLEPTQDDLTGTEFIVQRSGGLAGPYKAISAPLPGANQFIDATAPRKHLFRNIAYQVVLRKPGPPVVILSTSKPAVIAADMDLISMEIVRQFRILHRRVTGRLCATFSIRDFGDRCTDCFNLTQKRETKSNCLTCFGTGFRGGYFDQVDAFIDFNPTPQSVDITEFGEMQQSDTIAWATNYPPFKPRDLIVDPDERRWRVVAIRPIQPRGQLVQQFLQLREIQVVDVEYKLPVVQPVAPDDPFVGAVRIGGSAL